jgi:protein-tyrosine phosphatase
MFQVPAVLFICTGNIFRSRFAEAVFNHRAEAAGLGWCAFSRGLDPEVTDFDGISNHLRDALDSRGIALQNTAATKNALTAEDLEMTRLIIALSENEHRPVVADRFPDWIEQFNYWDIADHDRLAQEDAATVIEREVVTLIAEIAAAGRE